MKRCPVCGIEKPDEQLTHDRKRCKECHNKINRELYQRRKEMNGVKMPSGK